MTSEQALLIQKHILTLFDDVGLDVGKLTDEVAKKVFPLFIERWSQTHRAAIVTEQEVEDMVRAYLEYAWPQVGPLKQRHLQIQFSELDRAACNPVVHSMITAWSAAYNQQYHAFVGKYAGKERARKSFFFRKIASSPLYWHFPSDISRVIALGIRLSVLNALVAQ